MINESQINFLIRDAENFFAKSGLTPDDPIIIGYQESKKALLIAFNEYKKVETKYNDFFKAHANKPVYLNPPSSRDNNTDFGIYRSHLLGLKREIDTLRSKANILDKQIYTLKYEKTKDPKNKLPEYETALTLVNEELKRQTDYYDKVNDISSKEARNVIYEYRRAYLEPDLIDDEYLDEFYVLCNELLNKKEIVEAHQNNIQGWISYTKDYKKRKKKNNKK